MSDDYIRKERKRQFVTNQLLQNIEYYKTIDIVAKFQNDAKKAQIKNTLKSRLQEYRDQYQSSVESRRTKLSQLLSQDDEKYHSEILAKQIRPEDQIHEMRLRVETLRKDKEEHRQKIVAEKLLQQWRNDCDDLRSLNSKMLEKKCAKIRDLQLKEHEESRKREEERKKYYDDLWELERLKKLHREEEDRVKKEELNRKCFAILKDQIENLKTRKIQEEELKQQEARFIKEQLEHLRLEEERKRARHVEEQNNMRAALDRFNRARILQKQREKEETLKADLLFLSKIVADEAQEKEQLSRKRQQLREEVLAYRQYLLEEQVREKEFQAEIEKMYDSEAEKAWNRRAQVWIKEQRARENLMKEVIEVRREQIQFKLAQNQLRQQELAIENEEMKNSIKAHLDTLHQQNLDQRQKIYGYRNMLDTQMVDVTKKKIGEKEKDILLDRANKKLEEEWQQMLEMERDKILKEIAAIN